LNAINIILQLSHEFSLVCFIIQDENRRDKSGANNHTTNNNNNNNNMQDHLVQERMPLCIGICVLLAIVYVLTRTGDASVHHGVATTIRAAPPIAVQPIAVQPTQATSLYRSTTKTTNTNTKTATQTSSSSSTTGSLYGSKSNLVGGATVGTTVGATVANPQEPPQNCDLASLRAAALAQTPPFIIECAAASSGGSQSACHLPSTTRFAALGQKGAVLWMTGCSGAGKTTIATALEEILVKHYGKHVYRLDGDNLRSGLNRDLTFSEADRAESVRRTGELSLLFADAGVITLVGLISPFRADRDAVRKRHEDQGIPFYEIFLDVPVSELQKRDPKGQYARVKSGQLKHFTCIDDPYEEPLQPEITLKTHELEIQQSVDILLRRLQHDGILMGAPKLSPPGLPNPDGDEVVDLHVPENLRAQLKAEAETLPKVLITDIDLNWLQTIGEGWASPLKGFMREGTLLETLHFNSILTDPFNLTGNAGRLERQTNFDVFPEHAARARVSMSVPITLSCSSYTKAAIEASEKRAVALVTQMGQTVAILRDPEIYDNRKEEIVARLFGVIDMGHPYIQHIYSGGDYLIGGEIELLDRIRYNDGLDKWRKTVKELTDEFVQKGADTVYAFQTRNPTHAGHAYLMRSAGDNLRKKGYKKPVLWLSPLGGWTKSDDVPLDVRVNQHEQVLLAGTSHPGGLDPNSTVMAIWPAPMLYAGPTEVQFHAKSRRTAGASYFVVGRDPAGMKGSLDAVAHPDDDLYNGDHGRYVIQNSPGIGDMQMLSFVKVMYDVSDNVMKIPDDSRMDDFISISGSKMRELARNGATPCSATNIPTDLVAANCVPPGFMVPNGWNTVVDYYRNKEDDTRWIPWSIPRVTPPTDPNTRFEGVFGTNTFSLVHNEAPSWWHDIALRPQNEPDTIINMVTEIPMFYTAKMEIYKDRPGNVIAQDTNKDGSPRYYKYGTPFFNYGMIPQTWEDPDVKSSLGYGGDCDPIDVIELGSAQLAMGSVTPCRIIGSLELIDEGETDHKVLCIAHSDKDFDKIHSVQELERVKPGHLDRLRDWLKRYKTSDGKPENSLASDTPKTAKEAVAVVAETNKRWAALCGHDGTSLRSLSSKAQSFWLSSPNCRGTQ
jgi:3'-phosphoadenosine 5'-phosphosulfate synthase